MPGARVLIVDDDAAIVALVTAVLEDEGYTVASAVDGAALQVAQERPPAVILLDLMMPQMDGAEVSRRLRADGRTAAIPLILLSAQASAATAAALPVDDWLAKPFELEELVACVARWAALWTDGRLRWCRRGATSYAFDRARKRVVAWYLPQAGGWRVYVRDASTSYGPFATALAAQREAEKRVLA